MDPREGEGEMRLRWRWSQILESIVEDRVMVKRALMKMRMEHGIDEHRAEPTERLAMNRWWNGVKEGQEESHSPEMTASHSCRMSG